MTAGGDSRKMRAQLIADMDSTKHDAEFAKIFAAHSGFGREMAFLNAALSYVRRTSPTGAHSFASSSHLVPN